MDASAVDPGQRVRLAAFWVLSEQTHLHGEILPGAILATGSTFGGIPAPCIGPRGLFRR